jgi:hypothetical protein
MAVALRETMRGKEHITLDGYACWSSGCPMGLHVSARARRGQEQGWQIVVRSKFDTRNVILAYQPSQTQLFISVIDVDIDKGDEQVILLLGE